MSSDRQETAQNRVKEYLERHGPTPNPDLPAVTIQQGHGIRRFRPHRGSGGYAKTTEVLYLPTHDHREVIDAWLELNHESLSEISRAAITCRVKQQYDSTWVTAWRSAADKQDFQSHQKAPEDPGRNPSRACPTCGDEIPAREFVIHLQNCNE